MIKMWTAFVVLARALTLRVFAAQRSVYLSDSTFDDMLLATDIAWSHAVTNPTSCARLCVLDATCESYFHHEQQQQCHGVTSAHPAPTGAEAAADGYKYYKCTSSTIVNMPTATTTTTLTPATMTSTTLTPTTATTTPTTTASPLETTTSTPSTTSTIVNTPTATTTTTLTPATMTTSTAVTTTTLPTTTTSTTLTPTTTTTTTTTTLPTTTTSTTLTPTTTTTTTTLPTTTTSTTLTPTTTTTTTTLPTTTTSTTLTPTTATTTPPTTTTTSTPSTSAPVCGSGYDHHLPDPGLCYHFSVAKFNWLAGQAECEATGGSLVVIRTLAEFQFIDNVMKTYGGNICANNGVGYWVGGNYSSSAADYVWQDGVSMTTGVYYGQWATNRPTFVDRCVVLNCQSAVPVDYTDIGCNVSQYVICQQPVV